MELDKVVSMNEVTLQKIRFAVTQNLYPQDLQYDIHHDYMHDRMIHMLNWNLLGKEIETRTYPSTWWDGFKAKYYPKWLKARYPPEFDTFRLHNICPHIAIEWRKGQSIHLDWIEGDHGFDSLRPTKTSDES